MTTYVSETQKCCLCGNETECTIVGSTNTMGSSDLDLRPPPMHRETMHAWLMECQSCHYVSVDLARESDDAKSIVASEEYQSLVGNAKIPVVARRFEFCALLNDRNREISGTALLRAAWACDDESRAELAKSYRNRSADTLKKMQPFEDDEEQATIGVMLIDVLRRAERFEEALKLAGQLRKFKAVKRNAVMSSVVHFQISLCHENATDCRKVEEAVEA